MSQAIPAAVPLSGSWQSGVGLRLGAVAGSHTLVDFYAAFVPPLLGVLEVRCQLTPVQTAWLLGIGSLSSGLSQPLSAWLSDRVDSRLCGAAGLALAAVCLSCIGLANSFATLVPLYMLGMIGVGIFHPTGASSMGQLADRLPKPRRSLGLSIFFVAGMLGGITGSFVAPRIAGVSNGFALLRYLLIPGLLGALLVHLAIRTVPHRHDGHHALHFAHGEIRNRWLVIGLLFFSNALRFTVNMTILYLFLRWVHEVMTAAHPGAAEKALASSGSHIVGNLNALLILGMGIGGLSAGALIRQGREKWPMVLIPIVFAPAVALFPWADLGIAYLLSILIGAGFASMVPVTLSVAQQMLPHRTSLASSLMLGGAWALSFSGPRAAEFCLGTLELGLKETFGFTAALLAIAGLACLPLSSELIRRTARPAEPPRVSL